jgi:hypothetical protein
MEDYLSRNLLRVRFIRCVGRACRSALASGLIIQASSAVPTCPSVMLYDPSTSKGSTRLLIIINK